MAKAYYIVQWALYESADTRKTENMVWYKKRTKLTGLGIGKVMREPYPKNMELFGVWTVLETLATQSSPQLRGWLVRDGVPLDFDDMSSLIPTVPAEAFRHACEWFTEHIPGWFKLEDFPISQSTAGKPSGQSPGVVPPAGKPSGQSPARERDRESLERENPERESTPPAVPSGIPEWEEVLSWARLNDVDEKYAQERFHSTTEKHAWESNGRVIDWRKRFKRFWTEDKDEWFLQKKRRAATAPAGDRPDAWKEGDEAWWWNDPIPAVEAALNGALLGKQKKTAARLREILKMRKGK
jgi:hypothetical protein